MSKILVRFKCGHGSKDSSSERGAYEVAHQNSLPFPKAKWFKVWVDLSVLSINSSVQDVGEGDALDKQEQVGYG